MIQIKIGSHPAGDRCSILLKILLIGQYRTIRKGGIDIVRKGDDFQMEIKDNDVKVNFKPLPFNRSETIGAFAYVVFEDGTAIAETMNIDELESSRKASKMGNSGAWKNQPWEMQKKTVIKRLMKRVEIDFETPTQADYYYEDEAVVETPQNVIDVAQNDIEENQNSIPFEVEG
jgi:phage RecT family recombinase